eukprot:6507451-Pyramimonas_sp.AAC.1
MLLPPRLQGGQLRATGPRAPRQPPQPPTLPPSHHQWVCERALGERSTRSLVQYRWSYTVALYKPIPRGGLGVAAALHTISFAGFHSWPCPISPPSRAPPDPRATLPITIALHIAPHTSPRRPLPPPTRPCPSNSSNANGDHQSNA